MNRKLFMLYVTAIFVAGQACIANGAIEKSFVEGLATPDLVSHCDSVQSRMDEQDAHWGRLEIKDSISFQSNGKRLLVIILGCVGKAELFVIAPDIDGGEVVYKPLEFLLPGLRAAIDTVNLNSDGTPDLRVNMTGGMHSWYSLFVSITGDKLAIISPPAGGEAFYVDRGTIEARDLDHDGTLEIIVYSTSKEEKSPRVYKMTKDGEHFEVATGMVVDDR